jgi:hypothetical protein
MSKCYIGIDPGASGGLACIAGGVTAVAMPATDQDLFNWLAVGNGNGCFAVLEKVGGYVGGVGQPGSAMFNFGRNYGACRMALTAARIPFEEVGPHVWQKALGIAPRRKNKSGGGGESKSAWKNRLKAAAQRLFPHEAVTLKTCDAMLIAEYCRRKREGKL